MKCNSKEKSIKVLMGASLLLITSFVMFSGCLDSEDATDEIDVLAVSILPQKKMVETIAGDGIEVVVMIPEGQTPHSYSPTPSQLLKASKVDIYFKVGSGVEFEETHLDAIKDQNPNMEIVDLSSGIDLRGFEDEHEDHEDDDHEHQGGVDPHIWLSISNLKVMAGSVKEALEEADPSGNYTEGYEAYIDGLDDVLEEVDDLLGPYTGERFLTYHPSWGYFAEDMGLVQMSIEEGGKVPGPQGVAEMISQAEELGIDVIFVEPQFDSSSAEQIADAIGGTVVVADPLSEDPLDEILSLAKVLEVSYSDDPSSEG